MRKRDTMRLQMSATKNFRKTKFLEGSWSDLEWVLGGQDVPKMVQDGAKTAQDDAKMAQDGAKIAQDGAKIAQDRPR